MDSLLGPLCSFGWSNLWHEAVLSEDGRDKGVVTAGRGVTSASGEVQGQTNKHRRVLERERSKCLWLINGNNFLSFNF